MSYYIFNGIRLPRLDNYLKNEPYLTLIYYPDSNSEWPYSLTVSGTKPYATTHTSGSASGSIAIKDNDDYHRVGNASYDEVYGWWWDSNTFLLGEGGWIWGGTKEEFKRQVVWTSYDLYLDGELYMKGTQPIEAALNANAMADSMRRFITQHIYGRLGEHEAGALISLYKHKPKTAFAVYSADDNSLTFYNNAAYEDVKAAVDAGKAYTYNGKAVTKLYTGYETAEYTLDNLPPWAEVAASVTTAAVVDTVTPRSLEVWFYNFTALASLKLHGLNAEKATSMKYMFAVCGSLKSIIGCNLNTRNVVNMRGVFRDCTSLTDIDVSSFDTSSATDMSQMFYGCTALESIYGLGGFNTSKVVNMSHMFYHCDVLADVDVSSFDTKNVTDMQSMFGNTAITSLDLSHFDTSKVTSMKYMFALCSALVSLNIIGFDTGNVLDMEQMFRGCGELTSLDLSSFDTSGVTTMEAMFYYCEALTTIQVSDLWSTAAVTNGTMMFKGDTKLKGGNGTAYNSSYIDATYARVDEPGSPGYFTYKHSAFAVYSADDNSFTFYNNRRDYDSITVGDTYKGKTVTNIYKDFETEDYSSASNLPWYDIILDITNVVVADVIRPKYTTSWFFCFRNCTSINLNKLDTSRVTKMHSMFYCCNALPSVDLSRFDTSKVTITQNMFRECIALTSLDLSTWNTAALATTSFMFYECTALETIYVSDLWSVSAVTTSNNMFRNCTSLKGGNGTVFNSSYVDKTYARIDTASTPGYFTRKDPGAQLVAYRYNGVELPELPEWDKSVYPYAYINISSSGAQQLILLPRAAEYSTYSTGNTTYTAANVKVEGGETLNYLLSAVSNGAWGELTSKSLNNTSIVPARLRFNEVIWSNTDIPNIDTGDTYLKASAPVPVYE